MPEVYNWQLGRKMLYPYEERHPKWQFAFVFNINRCLACQTCSMADKSTWLFSKGQEYMWWNNVETKPYGGYPQFYDVKITQLIEQVIGSSASVALRNTLMCVGGVVMLVGEQHGLSLAEYTPLQVKQSVTGYGKATKGQVQQMVKTILGLKEIPKPDDAADALAIAICHGATLKPTVI
jgi:hypothetical protein